MNRRKSTRQRSMLGFLGRLTAYGGIATIFLLAVFRYGRDVISPSTYFRIHEVRVIGSDRLDPHQVIRLSGIRPGMTLFEDLAPIRDRLEQHPMIVSADVSRKIPNALVVTIREATPVAYLTDTTLVPVDKHGRALPLDPSQTPLDLPVIPADSIAGRPSEVLTLLASIQTWAPGLSARISDATAIDSATVRLRLRNPLGVEALLPIDADEETVRRMDAAVVRLLRGGAGGKSTVRLDGRFRGQIVASSPRALR